MSRRLSFALLCLLLSPCAQATELRIAYPSAYAEDVFIKSLLASKALSAAGLSVAAKKLDGEAEAMAAVKTGGADIGVFTLADEDLRKLKKAGDETSLLTRPFVFKSAAEVFLMQKSFLGDAAAADLGAIRPVSSSKSGTTPSPISSPGSRSAPPRISPGLRSPLKMAPRMCRSSPRSGRRPRPACRP